MFSTGNPEFKHCILFTTKVRNEEYIQLQLSLRLGKKRFSCGKENNHNYQKAIKAGIEIDRYCDRCLNTGKSIDLNHLKQLVKSVLKPHLKVIESPKIADVWEDYVKFHLALNCWSDTYIHTHIARISSLIQQPDFPDTLDKPSQVLQWILDGKRAVATSKDRFKQFVAAIDWASKNDRLDRQLGLKWRDCLSSLNGKLTSERKNNQQQNSLSDEEYIDPFSVAVIEQLHHN